MKQQLLNALRLVAATLLLGILSTGCSGGGGGSSNSMAPAPNPPPTVTISSNPPAVASGGTTTLMWSTTSATSCTASGSWSGARNTSGTEVTTPINAAAAYTLTCTGSGGMAAATANVSIAPRPVVTLSATPSSIASGSNTTLMWTTTDATSCTASGNWSGPRTTSGSETMSGLTMSSTYTLTCTGTGGNGAATTNVTVSPAPTVTLTSNPSSVTSGGTTTLTWTSTDATSCTASGGWTGARATSGTENIPGLTAATAFTLSCTGIGGTRAATTNVVIMQTTSVPTVSLSANPATLASGSATTLTWTSTNATSCTASGGWMGSRGTNGTETQATITATTAYTLTCTGAAGTAAATANVAVSPRPTVALSAAPSAVASGNATTLTWTSTDATSCVASCGWTGARGTSGTEMQAPITAATVYTLTCTGPGGMGAASANVSIAPAPTVTISGTPNSVVSGGATTLTWNTTNATSCLASGGWSGTRGTSGSETQSNLTMASAFTLTCTGPGGMGAATANVTVTQPTPLPTVTISANPITVASGGSTTLTWSTTNANACTASGSWTGTKGTSGTEVRTNITAVSAFTLTCTGAGGTGSATANVSLMQAAGTFSTDFNLNENPISEAGAWRRANNTFTNVATANGTAFGTNGVTNTFDDSYALLQGFGANYTATAMIQRSANLNTGVTHEVELLLRFSDNTTTARGYECLFSFDGNIQIIRWDGINQGSMNFKDITQPNPNYAKTPFKTGDVIRASISGSSISVFVNGAPAASASDSTYSTGDPGIGFFTRPMGSSANYALTSYSVTRN